MITMLNIDCMEYMKTVPDKYFDLAIVDPPYGIGYDEVQNKQNENGRISNGGGWKKYKDTKWDRNVPSVEYFIEMYRVTKNQIVWGGNYFSEVDENGVIIWYKGENGDMKEGELAKTNFNTFKIFKCSRVDAYINNGENKIHPTQKPVALYKWLLKNYAKPEMKILDTHGGSFSSAIACYDFGTVEYVGCELDKDYFDTAVKRFNYHKSQTNLFK